ncbi:MAG: VOC family protein [Clostridia bacterium]|nr:VOC family protein [Clostridia bacterium]
MLEETSKPQKQIHFDFEVDDVSNAVEKAISLRTTKVPNLYSGEYFTTMFEPVSHPF